MTLLHIDSSILAGASASRKLSSDIVARLLAARPDTVVVRHDLAADPVPHLSGAHLMAAQTPDGEHDPAVREDVAAARAVLEEFLGAETVVIGLGMYNFTIPSQLKAWIDRILIAGRTFRYGPDGRPEGLAGGKRVILAIARGGFYGPGAPAAAFEHAESYLRAVFGFIGVIDVEVVVAEGLAAGPEHREAGLAAAQRRIADLAA